MAKNEHLEYNGVVVPILRYINSLPNAKAINIHGSVFSERGTPDIIGCVSGRMVAFECKRSHREELEPIQLWRLCEWLQAGAIVGGVASVDDVKLILGLTIN